jgi:hypothetical protein
VDVVVQNLRRSPTILRNESPAENHWLQLQLRGRTTNRDGIGTRVRVIAGDGSQVAEVHSGRGYQSHFGSRLHFGLETHDRADRVEIHWLGGGVETVDAAAVNRRSTAIEGAGTASPQDDR